MNAAPSFVSTPSRSLAPTTIISPVLSNATDDANPATELAIVDCSVNVVETANNLEVSTLALTDFTNLIVVLPSLKFEVTTTCCESAKLIRVPGTI